MSCMFSTNDCVPAGTFVQVIAGDSPSPTATPGAAWLYFTGICPPSENPATVMVIGGAAGAPPRCCAETATASRAKPVQSMNVCVRMSGSYHRAPSPEPLPSSRKVRDVLLVFQTGVFEEIGIEREMLVEANRPRSRVGLRIVNRDFDLEPSERRPPEFFREPRGVGQRAAVEVGPQAVPEPGGRDDERVFVPLPRRISAPRRIGIDRERTRVCEDLAEFHVALVENHEQPRRVHDFLR